MKHETILILSICVAIFGGSSNSYAHGDEKHDQENQEQKGSSVKTTKSDTQETWRRINSVNKRLSNAVDLMDLEKIHESTETLVMLFEALPVKSSNSSVGEATQESQIDNIIKILDDIAATVDGGDQVTIKSKLKTLSRAMEALKAR